MGRAPLKKKRWCNVNEIEKMRTVHFAWSFCFVLNEERSRNNGQITGGIQEGR